MHRPLVLKPYDKQCFNVKFKIYMLDFKGIEPMVLKLQDWYFPQDELSLHQNILL